jgi:hypothetical protein
MEDVYWLLKIDQSIKEGSLPLHFIDEMLERLANHVYFCFLDAYSGFMQIPINPDDRHKTTFTCPYGTFPYRRMPLGLCNNPAFFNIAWWWYSRNSFSRLSRFSWMIFPSTEKLLRIAWQTWPRFSHDVRRSICC